MSDSQLPPENDDFDFEEAEKLISDVTESAQEGDLVPETEFIETDRAERSAKGLVRFCAKGFNWVMRTFKDPRVQWDDEIIAQAEEAISPALVKHGVGSGPIGERQEELGALAFTGTLLMETHKAVKLLKAEDEKKEKQKKREQEQGYSGQSQNESEPEPAETQEVLALPGALNEHIDFKGASEDG